jgi:hypothetical protein
MGNNFRAVANTTITSAKTSDFLDKTIDNATRKKINKSTLARSIPNSTAGDRRVPITREVVMLLEFGKIMITPVKKKRMIPKPSPIVCESFTPNEYRLCHILG